MPRSRLSSTLWRILSLLLLGSALAACSALGLGFRPAPGNAPRPAWPVGTATPTPLRPLQPTPTYLPTATPTVTPTPTPTATPKPRYGAPPRAVPPIAETQGRINLVLLGSDQRPRHWDFRTDTLIFVSYDPHTGRTVMASFPRDLYVRIPGYGLNRINTAMEFGGFPTLVRTLEYNFGLHPDHYILINFRGFKALVEALGGVEVQVPRRLCDHIRCVGPGWVHMNADVALWYARSRATTSDFDRARRQQALLVAIARRLLSLDALNRAPELYQLFRSLVITDLGLGDVASMVAQAGNFSPDKVETVVFAPPRYGRPWITPQGAYVVLPNVQAIQDQLRAMLR